MNTFLFISDPGHGWLRVKPIKDQISSFSYIDSKYVYLEEDCDATLFLDHLDKMEVKYAIKERYLKRQSRIREKYRYNKDNF